MTQKELIRQEIKRRMEELERDKYINIDAKTCRQSELKYLERFIDSMPEEKPSEDLVKEVKRYYFDNFTYISSDQPTLSILTNIARHFAEWQRKKMKKEEAEGEIWKAINRYELEKKLNHEEGD